MIGDLIGSLIADTALAPLTLLGTEQMGSCWGEWSTALVLTRFVDACPWDSEFTGATSELLTYLARWGPLGGHPKLNPPFCPTQFSPMVSITSRAFRSSSRQSVKSSSLLPAVEVLPVARPPVFYLLVLYTCESFVTAGLIITRVFAPDLHRLFFLFTA